MSESTHAQLYDVSMYHQLHCLSQIREYMFLLKYAVDDNCTKVQEVKHNLLDSREHHIEHCLDYIRQAIMCAGDMTLEWPREEDDGRRDAVDGWGVEHRCVDPVRITPPE